MNGKKSKLLRKLSRHGKENKEFSVVQVNKPAYGNEKRYRRELVPSPAKYYRYLKKAYTRGEITLRKRQVGTN